MGSSSQPQPPMSNRVRIVIASSVMLTFISFWRAAAIVLNDLGSSAFYAGSISEQAVGKAAPWFVIGVMLFSFAVRAVYVESCSMFVRGGVYRVVKEALGGTLAKISVSALMFDYMLTGPISGVSAGQYITGLLKNHAELPRMFAIFGIMMAFGHSILAMSGEESLAQVYREIGSPKLKNLKRTALTIAIYSFVFTGISSLFAVMLIPDGVRMSPEVKDNLLGAMVMYFAGPRFLKLVFRAFVVVVG